MTTARLILAIVSTALEEAAIVVIWRWLLPEFGIELPFPWLIGVMAVWAVFCASLFVVTTRILKKQAVAGGTTMVGSRGRVVAELAPEGLVKIKGELWGAISAGGKVAAGDEIEVVSEDGLKLVVQRAGAKEPAR